MSLFFKQFVNNFNKPKVWLILANALLAFFLILLKNSGVIPMAAGDFIFFAFLMLAFALYRPGWAFLIFIGMIILENINLAPQETSIMVRPYQLIGGLIIFSIIIRLVFRKLYFKPIRLKWFDWLLVAINISGFLSLTDSTDKFASLKLGLIFATFTLLYFLVRNYIQTAEDLKKIVPFILGSSIVVVLYGIWQNIIFIHGGNSFEIMPGRPNATFTEADWFGMGLVLIICVIYALWYSISNQFSISSDQISEQNANYKMQITKISLYIFIVLTFIALILTVSRSVWLGALATTFIFLFIILTNLRFNFKDWQWKLFFKNLVLIFSAGIISLAVVYVFHLTNFQLFNRAQSVGSGMQKITVSCRDNINLPENIDNVSGLEKYNCRHINLEEIESEKTAGKFVAEVYRKDPNVNIRSEIYQKSWQEIKNHPVLGIGWGSIGEILGKDDRGASLNSSNIFFEVWLGSGIIGIICFSVILIYILFKSIAGYFYASKNEAKTINLFFIISWFGIIIANLFNAGIFLGFLWVWIAAAQIYDYRN